MVDLTREEQQWAEIYDFTLKDGLNTKLYLTNYGGTYTTLPIIDGNTYRKVPISRTRIALHTDLQVDSTTISFGSQMFSLLGKSIIEMMRLGWFSGADILIRAVNPKMTAERREIFRGLIGGDIEYSRKVIKLRAVSNLDLLKQTLPRDFYTEQCNARLYDERCKLDKAAYQHSGTAGTGSTKVQIFSAIFDANFTLGEIRMTSGANNGISRAIRVGGANYATVFIPFDFDIAVGDSFLAWWGCDRAGTTCYNKFLNGDNFRGFEYIPSPHSLA